MKMAFLRTLVACFGVLSLTGCLSSGEDELRGWIAELRTVTKPKVIPLDEPKQFFPEDYDNDAGMEPFNSARLTQALKRDSVQSASNATLIAPEMARRKEPLEAYPLDAIRMVGSLNKASTPTALVLVDNLLHQVRVGGYMGQNYGRIVKISESGIQLREIVQDPSGDWVERITTLELQEGAEVKK